MGRVPRTGSGGRGLDSDRRLLVCARVRACVNACVYVNACPRARQAAALAEAQAVSREMKEKFVRKNNEFRAAQADRSESNRD